MKNIKFLVLLLILALVVLSTTFIIQSYNPSKLLQLEEQKELMEIAEMKSLLGEAYTLIQENELNAAEKRLHLLLRKAPRNISALQMLGNVYFSQKKYSEAEKTFRTLVTIDSQRSINYNNLGQTLAAQGKYFEAVPELKKASILAPELVQPHLNLAEIYVKLNHKKAAVNELKKAFELGRKNNSLVINMTAFEALKDEAEFRELLQLNSPKGEKNE
ncbi:MAG: tetratricopeptide repeat protein [Lentisphaeria bacterium]|nr:tetratricopeptide repeat protein [Lentisphaeria bacterium]